MKTYLPPTLHVHQSTITLQKPVVIEFTKRQPVPLYPLIAKIFVGIGLGKDDKAFNKFSNIKLRCIVKARRIHYVDIATDRWLCKIAQNQQPFICERLTLDDPSSASSNWVHKFQIWCASCYEFALEFLTEEKLISKSYRLIIKTAKCNRGESCKDNIPSYWNPFTDTSTYWLQKIWNDVQNIWWQQKKISNHEQWAKRHRGCYAMKWVKYSHTPLTQKRWFWQSWELWPKQKPKKWVKSLKIAKLYFLIHFNPRR